MADGLHELRGVDHDGGSDSSGLIESLSPDVDVDDDELASPSHY
jgi:hypothetical protein